MQRSNAGMELRHCQNCSSGFLPFLRTENQTKSLFRNSSVLALQSLLDYCPDEFYFEQLYKFIAVYFLDGTSTHFWMVKGCFSSHPNETSVDSLKTLPKRIRAVFRGPISDVVRACRKNRLHLA